MTEEMWMVYFIYRWAMSKHPVRMVTEYDPDVCMVNLFIIPDRHYWKLVDGREYTAQVYHTSVSKELLFDRPEDVVEEAELFAASWEQLHPGWELW